jgi:hypothetical protein
MLSVSEAMSILESMEQNLARLALLEYQAVRTWYRLDEGTDVAYNEKTLYVHCVHGTTFGRT